MDPISNQEIVKFLSSIQPFKQLSQGEMKEISLQAREDSFSKGETIYNEGEIADTVWVLYKGRIRILKYTSEGKTFAIESLGPGELFGTLCRVGGNERFYPCTAEVVEPAIVLRFLDRTFLQYYAKSSGLARGVCSLCAERLKDVQNQRCVEQESVPVRIASILFRLYQVHGATVPFTKKEIAELSGTALETTFRTLAQFHKNGILNSLRGKIHIKKPEHLKTMTGIPPPSNG